MIDVLEEFKKIWDEVDLVSDEFIERYEAYLKQLKQKKLYKQPFILNDSIKPNKMQYKAMINLDRIRKNKGNKALIIAATATGKTYMSAFDVKQSKANKVLFIAHRAEIINKSMIAYQKVLGSQIDCGLFSGDKKQENSQYLFATIQSIHNHLDLFDYNEFDYIVIDEAHHVGGYTYQKVLKYFKPKFLLGMSATPSRCDNYDIYAAFDYQIALNLSLQDALEEQLVVPFHYFGIQEYNEIDLSHIDINNQTKVFHALKLEARVDYIVEQMQLYGHDGNKRKALAFCVNVEHAKYMSEQFNKRKINSICLSGHDDFDKRQKYLNKLENDDDSLEIICCVDIFNEGIDIPSINLVLMLRPTSSATIFIQQLGRGLRKHQDKTFLTVLDFIANHQRSFLMAIALSGNQYYDKDSLKVNLKNNFANIKGNSFIQLNEISKQQILNQIDIENFHSMKYLKDQYDTFKLSLSGMIPYYLMDYYKYHSDIDPLTFIQAKKTYIAFLACMEQDQNFDYYLNDRIFMKCITYLSSLLPLKRIDEFVILNELFHHEIITIDDCMNRLKQEVVLIDEARINHVIRTLLFDYYDVTQVNKYLCMVDLNNNDLTLTQEVKSLLKDPLKQAYLEDIIHYGMLRYHQEFDYKDVGLKKYMQYSMQEVALVSQVTNKFSSFRGSGLLTHHNHYYLFVDLHKEKDIKESINYHDCFIDQNYFQWQSPNNVALNSDRGKRLTNPSKYDLHLHLFVRKFKKIDRVVQKYIYLGKVDVVAYEGEKPITMKFKLKDKLSNELYLEFITK